MPFVYGLTISDLDDIDEAAARRRLQDADLQTGRHWRWRCGKEFPHHTVLPSKQTYNIQCKRNKQAYKQTRTTDPDGTIREIQAS